MKSWRSRARVGIIAGIAAATLPMAAATAVAEPPPGDGWHNPGALHYDSKSDCEASEIDPAKEQGYSEVWCDGPGGPGTYLVYYR
ncbi:hypothetical protein [Saccharopolyspora sp. CA-218241]|uniref:hypothetical protein n=1 Tax=Saccharopolyspora sp. CA-218241 TaxID=3240027 RepID=UPI003D98C4DD